MGLREMPTTVAVIYFPGSNTERDCAEAVRELGGNAHLLFHDATDLGDADAVIIPGGFAHGDYLRPGAIAQFSPVMSAVRSFAREGGPVVGICNGFQILTEAGLLPGALQKNRGLKFLCGPAELEVVTNNSVLTRSAVVGSTLRVPINHFEGNYVCDEATLRTLRENDQIVLRYVNNPNGSVDDIAGVASEGRNVVGLMPHPERATHPLLGSDDGRPLLQSLLDSAGTWVSETG